MYFSNRARSILKSFQISLYIYTLATVHQLHLIIMQIWHVLYFQPTQISNLFPFTLELLLATFVNDQ